MKLDSVEFYAHAKTLKQQDLAKTLSLSRDTLRLKLERHHQIETTRVPCNLRGTQHAADILSRRRGTRRNRMKIRYRLLKQVPFNSPFNIYAICLDIGGQCTPTKVLKVKWGFASNPFRSSEDHYTDPTEKDILSAYLESERIRYNQKLPVPVNPLN